MPARSSSIRAAFLAAGALLPIGLAAADAGPFGRWLAEDIGGGGVIDRLETTLEIEPSGAVSGFGGCNRFRGHAEISGAAISFGPLAATRKMCPPAIFDQETKFFRALDAVRSFERDPNRRKLSLRDVAGRTVAVLALRD